MNYSETNNELSQEINLQELKYGERNILEGELITFPNPRIGRRYDIKYIPNERVVELKAIKLYINSYRDRYISHEESVNQILDDFVAACDPLEVKIKGDFSPRGNVHTTIEVEHYKK